MKYKLDWRYIKYIIQTFKEEKAANSKNKQKQKKNSFQSVGCLR